MLKIGAWLHVK